MLEIIARSVDATLAFQALASRIARLVPCDRVGLALLTRERPGVPDLHRAGARGRAPRAAAPRDRVQGRTDGPRQRRPLARGADRRRHLAGGGAISSTRTSSTRPVSRSALIVPLVSKGRVVGTLNLVQRAKNAYRPEHVSGDPADRRDLRRRRHRAAAAGRARQVPVDGSDVGADAVDRDRDQQRPADDHRALRSAGARLSRSQPAAGPGDGRAAGAADRGAARRRCAPPRTSG